MVLLGLKGCGVGMLKGVNLKGVRGQSRRELYEVEDVSDL